MESFRKVLGLRRVPATLVLMFVAKIPVAVTGIGLTLHVVTDLGGSYAAAGFVGTAATVGSALGAPLVGRMIDRHGLRPVVAVCGVVSTIFWLVAGHLPYAALVVLAVPACVFIVPGTSLSRQALTALTPPEHRRAAMSLDSVTLELSFMAGPAAVTVLVTQMSGTAALTGIGLVFGALTIALLWYNPPLRHEFDVIDEKRPPLREWLTRPLSGALLNAVGALFCLAGIEIAVLAALRATNEVAWYGLVIGLLSVVSAVGGLVHGGVKRSLSLTTLMVVLGGLTIPAVLATSHWWLLLLVLIPANLACAPTIAATAERVGELAPARVRGEAMGLLDSGTRIGLALGSPIVGFTMDRSSPGWGFVTAGLGALLVLAVALILQLGVRRAMQPDGVGETTTS